MATIYEVSELAGVSLATVSRVMNKNARVSDKTKEKVLAAMKQLDYRPNSIAQSLASNCSNSVGILVSELSGYFYGAMLSGIESELRAAHKHVIIAAGHAEEATEIESIEFLIGRNCDALILHVEAVSDEYLIKLSQGSIPIVLINRYIEEIADRCISLNNEQGGYLATKALLEQGHTDLAMISGPLWKEDAKNRLNGHKRALEEFNVSFNESLLVEGDYKECGGSNGMQRLLDKKIAFTAVVCANDETASGAMTVAREHKLHLPADISIIGFDNTIFARHLYPKLSTVNYPVDQMGKMAATWVLKYVYKNDNLLIDNLFKPELITRDSISTLDNTLNPELKIS
ncbi:LacI family DNA-binding transcriptional regulator [Pseudoalteromonas sp. C2R02]|uniref:LacI family DNA-binding transcriptional regulator n=1 Tax=Pseudoalteromonas sp. C2R02 TaxID=2841565 RepID=UPI001C083367|nr:LacI family DNA-binding transcriptional regulator [Pseudoalteromonas sp. C2R02]MBU2968869.1 LacI family DNA-binding transcriptional regulator [Pseudoalteromonas sp. C2R02]